MKVHKKYFLVKRKISPYTHSDIIIGIFDSNELAEAAKIQYIEKCNIFDKWAEQAYKVVNLESDIKIQEITKQINFDYDKTLNKIFVVSRFEEAFGQITRSIDNFLDNDEDAKKYCENKNDDDDEDLESFCSFYYDYEQIEINRFYFEK